MKKLITTIIAAVVTATLSLGQVIPNPGFETWTNNGTYEEPTSWTTSNLFSFFSDSIPVTVEKTMDAHSGTYAAMLTSKKADAGLQDLLGMPYDTIPGILAAGDFSSVLGFPYAHQPATAQFYAKYVKMGTDTGAFVFTLSKWNTQTNQQDIVGQAAGFLPNNINAYQLISLPINYISNVIPDTLTILFVSSAINILGPQYSIRPFPGTTLYVDDVSMVDSIPNNINEAYNNVEFKMYPNPTTGILNIMCMGIILAKVL